MTRLSDYLDTYIASRRGIVAAPGRLMSSSRPLRDRDIEISTQADLAAWVKTYSAARATRVKAGTYRRELITLRAALLAAWKSGAMTWRPHVDIPPTSAHRQRWLTPTEARALVDHASQDVRLAILMMLYTGARLGAIIDLTWSQVDLALGIIDYRRPDDPMFGRRKNRAVVPISAALHAVLMEAASRRDPLDARVVRLGEDTLYRGVRRAAQAAGLAGVSPHVLRHTAATWMLAEARLPLAEVARMLGHKSSLITETVYAHIMAAHLRPAAEAIASHLDRQAPDAGL